MSGAAGAAAAAAAIAQAIKASGTIVSVEPDEFLRLLNFNPEGLVVHAPGGWFYNSHRYVMSYKGLAFCTLAPERLPVPSRCQIVEAAKIWVP